MTDFCGTCKFVRVRTAPRLSANARNVSIGTLLQCQFNAPGPLYNNSNTAWPEVAEDDWCGEYLHEIQHYSAAIAFAGSGGFSPGSLQAQKAAITFAGAGAFTGVGFMGYKAAVSFAGTGDLSADGSVP